MRYFDLLIGYLIGFISSILTYLATKKIDSFGKVILYTKIVHRKEKANWGFVKYADDDISLHVPVWVQIQNTSSSPKIIRDLNLVAYKNNNTVGKAKQINHSGNNDQRITYGNKGSYSFVIEPLSIVTYECLFVINSSDITNDFDELRITYFDTKNRTKTFKFREIDKCWDTTPRETDKTWIKISESKK